MALPNQKTKPKQNLEDFIIFIYGLPKIGKSTFASKFNNPIFLATEAGLDSLEVYQIPINSWQEFLKTKEELKRGEHNYKTIVIDTVDNLFLWCNDFIMKKHLIEHASDLEWGKGWELVRNEFRRHIIDLSFFPYGLIMISHSEEREIRKRHDPDTHTKITFTLPRNARHLISGMADMILFFDMEKDKRIIRTKPSANHDAGDRTGRLSELIPLNYNTFLEEFYASNGVPPKKKKATANLVLITQIVNGENWLAQHDVDNFNVEKRLLNSREKHLGAKDIKEAKIDKLQAYLQHLREKSKQYQKEVKSGKNPPAK